MESWLALGPAASATSVAPAAGAACRYTVTPDAEAWLHRGRHEAPPVIEERLDPVTLMKESFLMGFRYIQGPDETLFKKRFRRTIEQAAPETIRTWRGNRRMRQDKAALTKEGLLLLDRFLVDAFREIDSLDKEKDYRYAESPTIKEVH
jgi:coproporphyrinogen III oxidase-like Fe-S oxidoreductase